MMGPRATPFSLVFELLASERFPAIRDAIQEDTSLGRFLMTPAAVDLLHELRPDEGLGDAVDDFVTFVYAAFRHWADELRRIELDEAATLALLETGRQRRATVAGSSAYVQVAPRLLWGKVDDSDQHEPIDGWFAIPEGDQLRVVACLGVHPARPGLSVVSALGADPPPPLRDAGAPFEPLMEGGKAAGLHSVASADELLWLGWGAALD